MLGAQWLGDVPAGVLELEELAAAGQRYRIVEGSGENQGCVVASTDSLFAARFFDAFSFSATQRSYEARSRADS
jgi:hypothetical protein